MKKFTLLALAAFLAACGTEDAGTTSGALHVQVMAIQAGDAASPAAGSVDAITVTVDHDATDFAATLDLVEDTTTGAWSGTSTRLLQGAYTVTAVAYAAGVPVFESQPTATTVTAGQTAAVVLVMNQKVPDAVFDTPHITSVTFDKMDLALGEAVQIEVTAEGGQGALQLSGRHFGDGAWYDPADMTTPLTIEPTANPLEKHSTFLAMTEAAGVFTGHIAFEPQTTDGARCFYTQVTDADLNMTEMGFCVYVDMGYAQVTVTDFNAAPTFDVQTRTVNDWEGAYFYFFVGSVADDDTVDYMWSSTCEGIEWRYGLMPAWDTWSAWPTGDQTFHAWIPGDLDPALQDGCTATLTFRDADGAESAAVLTLHTEQLEPAAP